MTTLAETQLTKALSHAHAMELQEIRLLETAARALGSHDIGVVYSDHLLETLEHERHVAGRLFAHGGQPSLVCEMPFASDNIAHAVPDTPIMMAATTYAFEHHEIASYRLLVDFAERAGDEVTAALAAELLAQEEAAALRVAGTFGRALDLALDPRHGIGQPASPSGL